MVRNGRNGTDISEWNMEDARMEWNGMEDFKNGMKGIFHTSKLIPYTRFRALYLQKNAYRYRVMINNIVTEVFYCNIYAYYLSTNRSTLVVYIAQTVYVLHHCKYIAICSIDVIVDDFDRFDLFFFWHWQFAKS